MKKTQAGSRAFACMEVSLPTAVTESVASIQGVVTSCSLL